MKVLTLNQKIKKKEYMEIWKDFLLPVSAKKVNCSFSKDDELDLLSMAVYQFLGIKDRPNISEIASLLDFPRSTIERVVENLIYEGYIDYNLNHLRDTSVELETKCGYLFYNRINGEQIPGILFMDKMDQNIQYSDSHHNDKIKLEDNNVSPIKNSDGKGKLNRWIRLNHEDTPGDLCNIDVVTVEDDYLMPIRIYYNKGDISWKVNDIFETDKRSFELQNYFNKLILESPKLKDVIEKLSRSKKNNVDKYDSNKKVRLKYGTKICSLPIFTDLMELEKRIYNQSDYKLSNLQEVNNCYNNINKIVEYFIITELENRNITIPIGNIVNYCNELIKNGFEFSVDADLKLDFFKKWIKELDRKRKKSAHSGTDLISDTLIKEDYEIFLKVLQSFTGEVVNADIRISKNQLNLTKARDSYFQGLIKWPFLPTDAIHCYTLFEIDNCGINKAKFWESVLLWFIRKEGLTGGELVPGWREKVKEKFAKSETEIHRFFDKPPSIHYMKQAVDGNNATLGAYAYLIFLSGKPKGNKNLQSVLGDTWWNELRKTVENRNNHYTGEKNV